MKTKYEEPYVEVITFNHVDVITTSGGETGVQWKDEWTDTLDLM